MEKNLDLLAKEIKKENIRKKISYFEEKNQVFELKSKFWNVTEDNKIDKELSVIAKILILKTNSKKYSEGDELVIKIIFGITNYDKLLSLEYLGHSYYHINTAKSQFDEILSNGEPIDSITQREIIFWFNRNMEDPQKIMIINPGYFK